MGRYSRPGSRWSGYSGSVSSSRIASARSTADGYINRNQLGQSDHMPSVSPPTGLMLEAYSRPGSKISTRSDTRSSSRGGRQHLSSHDRPFQSCDMTRRLSISSIKGSCEDETLLPHPPSHVSSQQDVFSFAVAPEPRARLSSIPSSTVSQATFSRPVDPSINLFG